MYRGAVGTALCPKSAYYARYIFYIDIITSEIRTLIPFQMTRVLTIWLQLIMTFDTLTTLAWPSQEIFLSRGGM